MIARIQHDPVQQLKEVSLHPNHPFQPLASFAFEAIHASWKRHNVGVVVVNGETGVAAAAMDVSIKRYIPLTGFAQRGKENESGNMSEQHQALLLEPSGLFSILSQARADAELRNYSPYATHHLRQEADELNSRYSDAVVIMLAGDKGLNEWVDGGRLQALGKTTPTFVCDLTDDCATQALRLEEFLMQHRPWFLNVVGARESASEMCTFSIKERAQTILNAALR